MAPAYVANMAPPFVRYWKGWNRPISRRWLGSHKTVVGFGAGVLGAVLVTWLQARLDWDRAIVDYDHWLDLGVRMGTSSSAGAASPRAPPGSRSTSSISCWAR